ncbi:MAG: hypothetical protein Kow00127_22500 [Bacteroidales bacterium]
MKRIFNLLFVSVLATVFLASCGGSQAPKEEQAAQQVEETQAAQPEATGLEAQLQRGEQIFKEKCIVCHQADAKGLKGAFPPLAGSDYLLADPVRGIHQTLNGSHEEMVVNGEVYNAPMVPQVTTKEDALAVVNYVLKHFNNFTDDQLLTMDDIADVEINPMKIEQTQ